MTLGKVLNLSEHQFPHLQSVTIIPMHRVVVSTKCNTKYKEARRMPDKSLVLDTRQLKNSSDLETHRLGSRGHGAHPPPLPEEQGAYHVIMARTTAS